ncbi:MAG TPA: DUF4215 domain-containing protein, partial [Candidatus Peribacteraceae bacterium]|nr:DUF4215 domain-containing protein [Candidatus Peribacteraceae bacterium]
IYPLTRFNVPRQILGGTSEQALTIAINNSYDASPEEIELQDLTFTVRDPSNSIDSLQLIRGDQVLARATTCPPHILPPSNEHRVFCAHVTNGSIKLPTHPENPHAYYTIIVNAVVKSSFVGGVSGGKFSVSMMDGGLNNPAIRGLGVTTRNEYVINPGDPMTGAPALRVTGAEHTVVMSEISEIFNARETHNPNIPLGASTLAEFTFQANYNNNDGYESIIDGFIFSVNARNVWLGKNTFQILNKNNPIPSRRCWTSAISGESTENEAQQRITGKMRVICEDLRSAIDSAIASGQSETFVLQGFVADPYPQPGSDASLQVIFERFNQPIDGFGAGGGSHVKWYDTNGMNPVTANMPNWLRAQLLISQSSSNFCGNGVVEPEFGEQCDDGNIDNQDGCNELCMLQICGDNVVQWSEECDDGNTVNGDGCNAECYAESCGDGTVQPPEECDDGNSNNNDSCTNACLLPRPTLSSSSRPLSTSASSAPICNNDGICGTEEFRTCNISTGVCGCRDCHIDILPSSSSSSRQPSTTSSSSRPPVPVGAPLYWIEHPEAVVYGTLFGTSVQHECLSNQDCLFLDTPGSCYNPVCMNGICVPGTPETSPNTCEPTQCGSPDSPGCAAGYVCSSTDICVPIPSSSSSSSSPSIACMNNGDCADLADGCFIGVCREGRCIQAAMPTTFEQCYGLCGNGIINPGEECDDGNKLNGDSCSSSCTFVETYCQKYTGCSFTDEQGLCQSGICNGERCVPMQEAQYCSTGECDNGILDRDEQCDDGNINSGDGCTPLCTVEPNYVCEGQPSACNSLLAECRADFNGDGSVGMADVMHLVVIGGINGETLAALSAEWGRNDCPVQ